MKQVTITLSDILLARAENYARERGTTIKGMISELLITAVEHDERPWLRHHRPHPECQACAPPDCRHLTGTSR